MSNEFRFEVYFKVPDDVGEENVTLVLNEFFGDLIETKRFIDARILDTDVSMNESERARLIKMIDELSEEEINTSIEFVEELSDE